MPILFVGDSGDIQETLEIQLRAELGAELLSCGFEQVPQLGEVIGDGVHLIIVGAEKRCDDEVVGRLLADEKVASRIPVVVFAQSPSGTEVLHWLKLGAAAVELWPCQSSRISFLLDYLTVGRRTDPQPQPERNLVIPDASGECEPIVLASSPMQRMIDQIHRIAPLDVNVLLSGETGVGKSRLARLLHDQSPRSKKPFFAVNCGALPENLLESELFGHKKGAFTGADSSRKGRFEEVGEGTLFLDEVDSIPIASQCKLLRAIDNRVFESLGSNVSRRFRGRIVAACNSPLEGLIENGEFRADLYYRLGVVDLYVPPLRERREDIRPIAEAKLREYTSRNQLSVQSISEEVLELLEAYHWPGNVRQLRNVIESSASLCKGRQIELSDLSGRWLAEAHRAKLAQGSSSAQPAAQPAASVTSSPASSSPPAKPASLAESRARVEADRIRSVLREVGNNRTQAALRLGISRSMLYKKIAKYGLADAC